MPVFQTAALVLLFQRDGVPVHQYQVIPTRRTALEVPRGNLVLVVCEACGFIFNQSFEPEELSYGATYDNTQAYLSIFEACVSRLVSHLIEERWARNCRIVEIGCGQGTFLTKLVALDGSGNVGYGFDPSHVGPLLDLGGRLRFERRFYDTGCANIPADVVVCRHVIEHLADPLNLLRAARHALAHSPHTRVFFQTPSAEWILTNRVIWDFFYEHCTFLTAQSLTTVFERSGFRVETLRPIFGGSICGWRHRWR